MWHVDQHFKARNEDCLQQFPSFSFVLVGHTERKFMLNQAIIFGGKSSYIGCFFNCPAQISVLKRKMLFNQRGSFLHREFHGTESLIGCPSFFILVLQIWRNSCSRSKSTSPPIKNCTLARLNNLSTFFFII